MNKGRIKVALAAIVLGISGAIATKPATANPLDVTWSRKGTTLHPSDGNEWVQGSGSVSCLTATRICTATFASGYDPNSHSYADNQTAATSIVVNNGYQP